MAQRTLVIDEKSGDIVTSQKNALDYETMPIVVVQVVATDLASHKTYATLTINVIDVNDVPPQLNMVSLIASYQCGSKKPMLLSLIVVVRRISSRKKFQRSWKKSPMGPK